MLAILPRRTVVSALVAGLTKSLARPVTRGLLPEEHAHAAIAAALARTTPPSMDLSAQIKVWDHILDLNIRNLEARRDIARAAIARVLRPLIAIRAPKRQLLAEAHNTNADHGRVLAEDEVEGVAERTVYWAIQKDRRHVS
jgi:hypothetical protein